MTYGPDSPRAWGAHRDGRGSLPGQEKFGGGAQGEEFTGAVATATAYDLVGRTTSFGAGFGDVWVMKLDTNGGRVWQQTIGTNTYDYAGGIWILPDGKV